MIKKWIDEKPGVVFLWGVTNLIAFALLGGFVAGGLGSSPYVIYLYGSSTGFIFLVSALVWIGYKRPHLGWRQSKGTGSIILYTIAFFLFWLGLAFGMWVSILAAFPLAIGLLLDFAIWSRKV